MAQADRTALEVGRFVLEEVERLFGETDPEEVKQLVAHSLRHTKDALDYIERRNKEGSV